MTQTELKRLKEVDYWFSSRYISQEAELIFNNVDSNRTESQRDVIALNVAKWNLEKSKQKLVVAAKKKGLIDAERILLDDKGCPSILTKSGKLYTMDLVERIK